jgi:hypothetical protein
MTYYFKLGGCTKCEIRDLKSLLLQKKYTFVPNNKSIYMIDTERKILVGIDEIPAETLTDRIFSRATSYKVLQSSII